MNVVLFQPEIPENTGNIARLCVITGCRLHLIRPLGFFLDNKRLKRAGLDYWEHLEYKIHDSWGDFISTENPQNIFLVETDGTHLYTDVQYPKGSFLVFGSESKGIDKDILAQYSQSHVTLPMKNPRSLNLSNTVAIVIYEAWRQHGFS
ncbi:MAG: tRNA (cytidine(34)-2'-O)-methyltransferase [Firmicutes bacterium]|nr:tRNA (cytidine(34)-2'-O)-methyltransferase [Bacillota bacterium]